MKTSFMYCFLSSVNLAESQQSCWNLLWFIEQQQKERSLVCLILTGAKPSMTSPWPLTLLWILPSLTQSPWGSVCGLGYAFRNLTTDAIRVFFFKFKKALVESFTPVPLQSCWLVGSLNQDKQANQEYSFIEIKFQIPTCSLRTLTSSVTSVEVHTVFCLILMLMNSN